MQKIRILYPFSTKSGEIEHTYVTSTHILKNTNRIKRDGDEIASALSTTFLEFGIPLTK